MKLHRSIILVLPILLSACSGWQNHKKSTEVDYDAKSAIIDKVNQEFKAPPPRSLTSYEKTPFITEKASVRPRLDKLPPELDQVTLRFLGRQSVGAIAEIIQRTTKIKVMVHPDVMVSLSSLVPNAAQASDSRTAPTLSTGLQNGITSVTSTTGAGTSGGERIDSNAGGNYFVDVPVNYSGSLSGFLDQIATRLGVSWDYKDGTIEIRRFVTRSFAVISLPGKNSFSSKLGKQTNSATGTQTSATGAQSTNTGSFNADMQVAVESSSDFWKSMEDAIKAMLTPMGKLAINQSTGTVTVSDIADVINRVGSYIDEENRISTRQVAFEVQVYSVRSNDDSDFGVDWNMVYTKFSNLLPDGSITFASPSSLAGSAAGALGLSILRDPTSDSDRLARWNGSEAFVKALASVGKLSRLTRQNIQTINRKAAPVAIVDQVAYAASTTPGTVATAGTGTSYGITPGTVTTGFVLNLVPTLTDRGSMLLTFALDVSDLVKIENFTSGTGNSAQSIQLPRVSSTQFMQMVALRSGETLVITGFERMTNNYSERTLGKDISPGLGGSYAGTTNKDSLVILVTPIIREGI